MMRRLFTAIAAVIDGLFRRSSQPMPSLAMNRLVGDFGRHRNGSNAAIKRQAIKRRNIAKHLPLKMRR